MPLRMKTWKEVETTNCCRKLPFTALQNIVGASAGISETRSSNSATHLEGSSSRKRTRSSLNFGTMDQLTTAIYTPENRSAITGATFQEGNSIVTMKGNKSFHRKQQDQNKRTTENVRKNHLSGCSCCITTTVETFHMPFISIHNIKNRKPRADTCVQGSINRRNTIRNIKNRAMKGKGPMREELQINPDKSKEVALQRMWHYVDTVTYLTKQKGTKEDMLNLVSELENLYSVLHSGNQQILRWMDAHFLVKKLDDNQIALQRAERHEATLDAEWRIRQEYKVTNPYQITQTMYIFRKMANLEFKIYNISTFAGEFQEMLISSLFKKTPDNIDTVECFQAKIRWLMIKVKLELKRTKGIIDNIDSHSPERLIRRNK